MDFTATWPLQRDNSIRTLLNIVNRKISTRTPQGLLLYTQSLQFQPNIDVTLWTASVGGLFYLESIFWRWEHSSEGGS